MRRFLTSVLNTLPNGAKAVQGERRAKRKAAGFSFSMPSRRLLYVKAVQGERRAKSKAAGYSFSMPSCRLLYVKVLRESALLLPRWGDKAGCPGNPGCRLATLGFALGCELYAPSGRSLTALNFYRTPIIKFELIKFRKLRNLSVIRLGSLRSLGYEVIKLPSEYRLF